MTDDTSDSEADSEAEADRQHVADVACATPSDFDVTLLTGARLRAHADASLHRAAEESLLFACVRLRRLGAPAARPRSINGLMYRIR